MPMAQLVHIRGCHGMYICAEANGQAVCNRREAREWETFAMETVGPNMVAFKSAAHNKYLSAQADGRMEANRDRRYALHHHGVQDRALLADVAL